MMAKKRFSLVITSLSWLMTLSICWQYGAFALLTIATDALRLTSALLCIVAFVVLLFSLKSYFSSKNDFWLMISVIVSNVISIVVSVLLLVGADLGSMIFFILFCGANCALYFLGNKYLGEEHSGRKFHFATTILFGIILGCLLDVAWAIMVGILGYFFYSLPKFKKNAFYIINAVVTAFTLIFSLLFIGDKIYGYLFYAFMSVAVCVIYFIVSCTELEKKMFSNNEEKQNAETAKPATEVEVVSESEDASSKPEEE